MHDRFGKLALLSCRVRPDTVRSVGGAAGRTARRRHAVRAIVDALESRPLLSATVQFASAAQTVNPSAGTFSIPVTATGTVAPNVSTFVDSNVGYTSGVVVDSSGNLYVSDTTNQLVHRVTPAGSVSNFAAGVGNATGLAMDSSGNLYVADTAGNSVHKVTSAGTVSTFATGFSGPIGLALDSSGNLYVTNRTGRTIDRVTPAGTVSTYATGFTDPEGPAFDAAGNLYVADMGDNTVKKVTPQGAVSTFAGGFDRPEGVAFDSAGNLFVTNFGGGTVDEVSPAGTVRPVASGLSGPIYMGFDRAGNLYATAGGAGVYELGPSLSVPFTLGGTAVAGTDYSGIAASPLVFPIGQTTADITGSLSPQAGANRTITVAVGRRPAARSARRPPPP